MVSILVLMDVPLQLCKQFNPCFNGVPLNKITIMSRGFNPCFNGCATATRNISFYKSSNPCFNGCATATLKLLRFNPCFNGCATTFNSKSTVLMFQSLF